MIKGRLGVITCDKCGKTMEKGQKIIIVDEGMITKSAEELDYKGSNIRFACHLDCWDGMEEIE